MAKMTLLEMTQNILSAMSSDEVNSIDDTSESLQVVEVLKVTFLAMCSNRNWYGHRRLLQFVPSGNADIPTHITVQSAVKEVSSLSYDMARATDGDRKITRPVKWREPEAFLRIINQRNNDEPFVKVVIDPKSLVPLLIRTDYPPTYYTSFDDTTIIFDSYDSQVDDTIQAHKIQAIGYLMPIFLPEDDFVPDIPEEGFIALLEEAKSRAFLELKQQPNQKAEQEARRQQSWLSRKDWRVKGGIILPNYGRVTKIGYQSSSYPRDPTFRRDD